MTSKEALKQYREIYIDKNYNGDIAPSQEWFLDIIEKDLEVLEILKNESDNKRIIIKDGIASFHLDMILTTDNYNKIKEWLENEN